MQNIWWCSGICSPGDGLMHWPFPIFLIQVTFLHSHDLLTNKVPMGPICLVQCGIQNAGISYKTLYGPDPHYLL